MIIIFDGLDNTGKDTQIKLLQNCLLDMPTHILHYSNIENISNLVHKQVLHKIYEDAFSIIKKSYYKRNLIFNRFLYSENVYSSLYRNYDGSYIFDIEKKYKNKKYFKNLYLIILIDSSKNLIERDDGLSLSTLKQNKEKEISKFIETFDNSIIKNKILINIENKSIEEIHLLILNFLQLNKGI